MNYLCDDGSWNLLSDFNQFPPHHKIIGDSIIVVKFTTHPLATILYSAILCQSMNLGDGRLCAVPGCKQVSCVKIYNETFSSHYCLEHRKIFDEVKVFKDIAIYENILVTIFNGRRKALVKTKYTWPDYPTLTRKIYLDFYIYRCWILAQYVDIKDIIVMILGFMKANSMTGGGLKTLLRNSTPL